MQRRNQNVMKNRKLMDFIIIVKSTKLKYATYKGKVAGRIIIDSMKLKYAIGKKVRVIIKTHYS